MPTHKLNLQPGTQSVIVRDVYSDDDQASGDSYNVGIDSDGDTILRYPGERRDYHVNRHDWDEIVRVVAALRKLREL